MGTMSAAAAVGAPPRADLESELAAALAALDLPSAAGRGVTSAAVPNVAVSEEALARYVDLLKDRSLL